MSRVTHCGTVYQNQLYCKFSPCSLHGNKNGWWAPFFSFAARRCCGPTCLQRCVSLKLALFFLTAAASVDVGFMSKNDITRGTMSKECTQTQGNDILGLLSLFGVISLRSQTIARGRQQ
nr:hypothetical protein [Pandoravirus massiliensis]